MKDEETKLCVRIMGLVQIALWKPQVGFVLVWKTNRYMNISVILGKWDV